MKKFVFSLSALLELKLAGKEKLRAEYAAAEAAAELARQRRQELEQKQAWESAEFEKRCRMGMAACDVSHGMLYLRQLQEAVAAAGQEEARAKREAAAKQNELVEVHREVKSLEKLERKQYLAWLAEAEKRETGAMEDLLSFAVTGTTAASQQHA